MLFNLISNPLIDLGILFELLLCYFFFYTPLSRIYYFAPGSMARLSIRLSRHHPVGRF